MFIAMELLEILLLATSISSLVAAKEKQLGLNTEHSCSHPALSCPIQPPSPIDRCCLNHPSGHFLLTQFWDAKPALGAADIWTTHGLWPDLCSGGFDQFCDRSREYQNVSAILKDASNSSDLLDFMTEHWLSLNGDNNHLWAHEWNKHGTCVSTIEPTCYSEESTDSDAILDYFNHATNLYSTLETYQTLAEHDIRPSHHRTYTLTELQDAITPSHDDYDVTFRCHGHELSEVWYHFSVRGSLRNATPFNASLSSTDAKQAVRRKFIPTGPDGAKTNCPARGIRYLPKASYHPSPTSAPGTTSTATSAPTSTSEPFSGRGHLLVRVINDDTSSSSTQSEYTGCLIRGGKWYHTSGSSCATYIAKADVNHLVSSPRAKCQSYSLNRLSTSLQALRSKLSLLFPSTSLQTPSPSSNTKESESRDVEEASEHLFTLSSLYSPCAILPLTSDDPGIFSCAKDLGIQSIFSYDNTSTSSGTQAVLSHLNKTTFYAGKVPAKFEKVDIYATDGDGDGDEDERRGVEVQIEWQAL